MGDSTKIEWTDATWNPVVGCSIVSPGCTNCYAMKMAGRIEAMARARYEDWYAGVSNIGMPEGSIIEPFSNHYAGTTRKVNGNTVWTGKVALAPEHILTQPLRWKRPRKIFVNSMGDLFHEEVPDEWIDQVFAIMALAPQHTFQVLTKRSARMRAYLTRRDRDEAVGFACHSLAENMPVLRAPWHRGSWLISPKDLGVGTAIGLPEHQNIWPLPNVWLGVSAEDQKRAIERIPDLLHTPAAIRFVSAEPLLGPLDLRDIDTGDGTYDALHSPIWEEEWANWKDTEPTIEEAEESFLDWYGLAEMPTGPMYRPIDWVIVGGESGPDARPMHHEWERRIRLQCAETGVAYLGKQWGEWLHMPERAHFKDAYGQEWRRVDSGMDGVRPALMFKAGKKRAGRLFGGVEHNGFPEVPA